MVWFIFLLVFLLGVLAGAAGLLGGVIYTLGKVTKKLDMKSLQLASDSAAKTMAAPSLKGSTPSVSSEHQDKSDAHAHVPVGGSLKVTKEEWAQLKAEADSGLSPTSPRGLTSSARGSDGSSATSPRRSSSPRTSGPLSPRSRALSEVTSSAPPTSSSDAQSNKIAPSAVRLPAPGSLGNKSGRNSSKNSLQLKNGSPRIGVARDDSFSYALKAEPIDEKRSSKSREDDIIIKSRKAATILGDFEVIGSGKVGDLIVGGGSRKNTPSGTPVSSPGREKRAVADDSVVSSKSKKASKSDTLATSSSITSSAPASSTTTSTAPPTHSSQPKSSSSFAAAMSLTVPTTNVSLGPSPPASPLPVEEPVNPWGSNSGSLTARAELTSTRNKKHSRESSGDKSSPTTGVKSHAHKRQSSDPPTGASMFKSGSSKDVTASSISAATASSTGSTTSTAAPSTTSSTSNKDTLISPNQSHVSGEPTQSATERFTMPSKDTVSSRKNLTAQTAVPVRLIKRETFIREARENAMLDGQRRKLVIQVIEEFGLIEAAHNVSLCVRISLGDQRYKTHYSSRSEGGGRAKWAENIVARVDNPQTDRLEFDILDRERLIYGSTHILLADLLKNSQKDVWLPLKGLADAGKTKIAATGEIHVLLTMLDWFDPLSVSKTRHRSSAASSSVTTSSSSSSTSSKRKSKKDKEKDSSSSSSSDEDLPTSASGFTQTAQIVSPRNLHSGGIGEAIQGRTTTNRDSTSSSTGELSPTTTPTLPPPSTSSSPTLQSSHHSQSAVSGSNGTATSASQSSPVSAPSNIPSSSSTTSSASSQQPPNSSRRRTTRYDSIQPPSLNLSLPPISETSRRNSTGSAPSVTTSSGIMPTSTNASIPSSRLSVGGNEMTSSTGSNSSSSVSSPTTSSNNGSRRNSTSAAANCDQFTPIPIYEGRDVFKVGLQGWVNVKLSFKQSKWENRWCVIDGNVIRIYEDMYSQAALGVLPLYGAKVWRLTTKRHRIKVQLAKDANAAWDSFVMKPLPIPNVPESTHISPWYNHINRARKLSNDYVDNPPHAADEFEIICSDSVPSISLEESQRTTSVELAEESSDNYFSEPSDTEDLDASGSTASTSSASFSTSASITSSSGHGASHHSHPALGKPPTIAAPAPGSTTISNPNPTSPSSTPVVSPRIAGPGFTGAIGSLIGSQLTSVASTTTPGGSFSAALADHPESDKPELPPKPLSLSQPGKAKSSLSAPRSASSVPLKAELGAPSPQVGIRMTTVSGSGTASVTDAHIEMGAPNPSTGHRDDAMIVMDKAIEAVGHVIGHKEDEMLEYIRKEQDDERRAYVLANLTPLKRIPDAIEAYDAGFLNLILWRLFRDMQNSELFANDVAEKIRAKIETVKLPPFLGNLRVLDIDWGRDFFKAEAIKVVATEVPDEVIAELDVNYTGGLAVKLAIECYINWPRPKAAIIPVTALVKLVSLRGKMHLLFPSELNTKNSLCFVVPPAVEFDVSIDIGQGQGRRVSSIPKLKQFLFSFARQAAFTALVHPSRIRWFWPIPGRKVDVELESASDRAKEKKPTKGHTSIMIRDSSDVVACKYVALEFFNHVLNQYRYERIDQLFAQDCIVHGTAFIDVPLRGRDGVLAWIVSIRKSFPDIRFFIDELNAAKTNVSIQWTARGTFKNDLWDYPATQDEMLLRGVFALKVREGNQMVTEFFVYWSLGTIYGLV